MPQDFLLIFACRAAMRSSNHGWRVDQTWQADLAIDRLLAWVMAAMATMVRFVSMASSRCARRPCRHLLSGRGERVVVDTAQGEPDPFGLGTVEHLAEEDRRRHLRPRRCSIHVWPPPGWRPIWRKRVSKQAAGGDAHVASEARFMPAPTLAAPLTTAASAAGNRRRRNPS